MSNSDDDDLFTSMDALAFALAKGPSPEAFRAALIAADAAYRGEPAPAGEDGRRHVPGCQYAMSPAASNTCACAWTPPTVSSTRSRQRPEGREGMKKTLADKYERKGTAYAEARALAHVALRLGGLLRVASVSQRDLAGRLGLTEARISQILSANSNPTIRTLARIADALGFTLRITFVANDNASCAASAGWTAESEAHTADEQLARGVWHAARARTSALRTEASDE